MYHPTTLCSNFDNLQMGRPLHRGSKTRALTSIAHDLCSTTQPNPTIIIKPPKRFYAPNPIPP